MEVLTRLPFSRTYDLGFLRQTYDSLRRESHSDGGADIDLALQVQSLPIRFTPTPTRARMGANRI